MIINIFISHAVASAVAVKNHSQSLEVLMPELDFNIRNNEAEKILQSNLWIKASAKMH